MMFSAEQADQAQKLRQLVQAAAKEQEAAAAAPGNTRVITVTSGKGGVGKTNLVVNMAVAMASRGLKVLVFDADLGLANIDVVMGLFPQYTLAQVVEGTKQIEDILLPGPGGVTVLPGGLGISKLADLSTDQFFTLLAAIHRIDPIYNVCFIDTGAGIGRQVLSFVRTAPEIIVVTTPEPTAVADAYGLIKSVSQGEPPAVSVVVNMADSAGEAEEVFTRLQTVTNRFLGVGLTYLGWVERDTMVSKSVKEQVPFVIQYPNAKASRCVNGLVDKLMHVSVTGAGGKSGLWGFFQRAITGKTR